MRKLLITPVVLLLVAALSVAGCGGSADTDTGTTDATDATPAAPQTDAGGTATATEAMQAFSDDGNVLEITIEGDDMMRFDIERFSVEPGQMVRLTLNHTGVLPAQAMGHNVVIIYPNDDVFEFGGDVGEQGGNLQNNYVPQEMLDRVVAYTELIGGGESTVVEFRAPDEPGEYPFLCSFPGHFGQMNGIMDVG